MTWGYIVFVLLYSVLNAVYNMSKKKGVMKSNEAVILFLFTGIGFLLSLIWIPFGVSIPLHQMWPLILKGALLAVNWFFVLKVLKTMDVSIVSLTTVISSVITFVVSVLGFQESATTIQWVGCCIVVLGAVVINFVDKKTSKKVKISHILILIASGVISAASSIIDKYTSTFLQPHQTQFWYFLFVFLFSSIFFVVECFRNKKFLIAKSDIKNVWIYVAALALFIGDFCLFIAYKMPGAQLILISALSKTKVIATVMLGVLFLHERNAWKKLLIALVMFAGILMITLKKKRLVKSRFLFLSVFLF